MISKENENLISRYDDPELSTAERQQLTELLETDDEARKFEAHYRRLDAELETLPDGLDGVDFSGFRRRIRESIEIAPAPVIRRPHRQLWTRWAPIAAAASVAIAFISIWHSFKSDSVTIGPIPPKTPMAGPKSEVKIASINLAPSEAVVNRIQLAAAPVVVEPSFAMDMESDSVYDDGGVICSNGSENEQQEAAVPSATGFFSTLMKGST